MNKLKILMQDWIMDSFCPWSVDDELQALPSFNLKNPDPTVPWQTTGTEASITIDTSGVEQPFDIGLFIGNHNFTPEVSITVTYDGGAPVTYDVSSFLSDTNFSSTDELFNRLFVWLAEDGDISADEIVITFSDPGNPDGFLRIGIVSVGPVGGEENFAYGFEMQSFSPDDVIVTNPGHTHSRADKAYDRIMFEFRNVGFDMRARLEHWIREGGYERERWIALSPNDLEQCTLTFYGQLIEFSGFAEELKAEEGDIAIGMYSCSLTILDLCPTPRNLPQVYYTTHEEFVSLPERTDVFLGLEIPGEPMYPSRGVTWTLDSGSSYTVPYPTNSYEFWQPVAVYVGDSATKTLVKQTRQTSTGAVDSNPGSWYHDIEVARELRLHCSDDGDPNTKYVEVQFVRGRCNRVPPEKKWLIMDIEYDGFTIPNVVFEPLLTTEGLGDIGQDLIESAFYGLAVPNASGVVLINGKKRYSDAHGRYDIDMDRNFWKQRYFVVYHGDGGVVFDFADHLFIEKFTIHTIDVNDETVRLNFEQTAQLNKMIPDNIIQDDQQLRLDWQPKLWGTPPNVKTFRQTSSPKAGTASYFICENPVDTLNATYNGDTKINTGVTLDTDALQTTILITPAPAKDATITVRVTRNVDVDLNEGADSQLYGAWVRSLLSLWVRLEEIPTTSFSDFDAAHPIEVNPYLGDRQAMRQILEEAAKATFSCIRKTWGIWEIFRIDFANLPDPTVEVFEDDILDCSKQVLEEAVVRQVRVPYLFDVKKGISHYVVGNHPNAGILYSRTEILELAQGFLNDQNDAIEVMYGYLTCKGYEIAEIHMRASGQAFRARPGDLIKINRRKAFSYPSGEWESSIVAVKSVTMHCMEQPGFCDLVLMDIPGPLTSNSASNGDVQVVKSAQDKRESPGTVGTVHEIEVDIANPNGYSVGVMIVFNRGVTSCIPDIVTYDGVDMTGKYADTSAVDSTNNRVAFCLLPAVSVAGHAGTKTVYVHFPAVVDSVAIWAFVAPNANDIRDAAAVRHPNAYGLSIEATVTSAAGDLIVDGYACSAPPPAQQNDGSGQVMAMSQHCSFNGTFISADALTARGTYKDGAASSTTMSHSEDLSTAAKTLLVVSLKA